MCLPSLPGARWPAGEAIGNRRHPHAGEAFLSDFRSCRRRATTLLAHSRPPAKSSSHALGQSMQGSKLRRERSEEHTSELQSQSNLVCRLLLEKKKKKK